MKFFTPAWHSGETADDEAARIPPAYQAHIRALTPPLPPDALRLVHEISLHDGLVRSVGVTPRMFELVIRSGDKRTGYFDAQLRYGGGDVGPQDREFLESAVGKLGTELLYDEFDSAPHGWLHRMLFWPYREVVVKFDAFSLHVMPASSRFNGAA